MARNEISCFDLSSLCPQEFNQMRRHLGIWVLLVGFLEQEFRLAVLAKFEVHPSKTVDDGRVAWIFGNGLLE